MKAITMSDVQEIAIRTDHGHGCPGANPCTSPYCTLSHKSKTCVPCVLLAEIDALRGRLQAEINAVMGD
jgi:hypothetical protein